MITFLSVMGVVFWVWVIAELIEEDDVNKAIDEEIDSEEVAVDQGENDLLLGTEGLDEMSGGEGSDILAGDEGADNLDGGAGDDLILGGADDDTLSGGEGDDVIDGGAGEDQLSGDEGDDLIIGSSSLDEEALIASFETAETTEDLVFQMDGQPDSDEGDTIDGGDGEDMIILGSLDNVTGGKDGDIFSGGWWIREDEPAVIEDYDPDEDALTYTFQGETEPVITTNFDPDSGEATVYADGDEVIIIMNATASFNADDITLLQVT